MRTLAAAMLVLSLSACLMDDTLDGSWGGAGISLEIHADTSRITLDCAEGGFLGAPTLGPAGVFRTEGWYTPAVGPVLNPPPRYPLAVVGIVDGDVLELHLSRPASGPAPEPFDLTFRLRRDQAPTLVFCR